MNIVCIKNIYFSIKSCAVTYIIFTFIKMKLYFILLYRSQIIIIYKIIKIINQSMGRINHSAVVIADAALAIPLPSLSERFRRNNRI